MDATIQPYLPEYPRKWLRRVAILALTIGLAVLIGYGVLVIVRATRVDESQENHSHQVAANQLWTLVANGRWRDESAVGRLARKLIEIKDEPNAFNGTEQNEPTEHSESFDPKAALGNYFVHTGEFSTAAHEIGWEMLSYKAEGTTYYSYDEGNFEPKFVDKALEATPRNLDNMLFSPPESIRGYGNYRWQWLAIGLVALWAVSMAIGTLLVRHRRIWQIMAERRFKDRLSPESYDVLHLIRQIEREPKLKDRKELLKQANDLFKVALAGSTMPRQEVKEELAYLGATYRKRLAAPA